MLKLDDPFACSDMSVFHRHYHIYFNFKVETPCSSNFLFKIVTLTILPFSVCSGHHVGRFNSFTMITINLFKYIPEHAIL